MSDPNDDNYSDVGKDDLRSLREDLNKLREDFVRIAERLRKTARNQGSEAAEKLRTSAERGWSEAKTTAETVVEERPLVAGFVLLVVGMFFGLLFSGRR